MAMGAAELCCLPVPSSLAASLLLLLDDDALQRAPIQRLLISRLSAFARVHPSWPPAVSSLLLSAEVSAAHQVLCAWLMRLPSAKAGLGTWCSHRRTRECMHSIRLEPQTEQRHSSLPLLPSLLMLMHPSHDSPDVSVLLFNKSN